jgi:DNA replication protein DnaC
MELSKRLTVADMKRANVPRRFWYVSLDNIPDGYRYKELVQSYIDQLDEMFRQGVGLYLWSEENSTGKTSLAVAVMKELMRKRRTAFFEEAGRLKNALVKQDTFEEGLSVERRARTVDVFVLDDIGKEYRTDSGYSESQIESILRERIQSMRVTVMTGNLHPKEIKTVYSPDMSAMLQEALIPIEVVGMDWRLQKEQQIRSLLEKGV